MYIYIYGFVNILGGKTTAAAERARRETSRNENRCFDWIE